MTAGVQSSSFAPVITASTTLSDAFPDVDPNYIPLGYMVLLQVRLAQEKVGGDSDLVLPDEVRATIQANTQVAKIIGQGPIVYCDRKTGKIWPEGKWCEVGDYVRIPKFGGDRWEVKYKGGTITFVAYKD